MLMKPKQTMSQRLGITPGQIRESFQREKDKTMTRILTDGGAIMGNKEIHASPTVLPQRLISDLPVCQREIHIHGWFHDILEKQTKWICEIIQEHL